MYDYYTKQAHAQNLSLKYGFIPDTDTDKDTRDTFHQFMKAPIKGTGLEHVLDHMV